MIKKIILAEGSISVFKEGISQKTNRPYKLMSAKTVEDKTVKYFANKETETWKAETPIMVDWEEQQKEYQGHNYTDIMIKPVDPIVILRNEIIELKERIEKLENKVFIPDISEIKKHEIDY